MLAPTCAYFAHITAQWRRTRQFALGRLTPEDSLESESYPTYVHSTGGLRSQGFKALGLIPRGGLASVPHSQEQMD